MDEDLRSALLAVTAVMSAVNQDVLRAILDDLLEDPEIVDTAVFAAWFYALMAWARRGHQTYASSGRTEAAEALEGLDHEIRSIIVRRLKAHGGPEIPRAFRDAFRDDEETE